MNKFVENCTKVGNLYRLYEDISINQDTIIEKKVLTEKLTESINGKNLKVYNTYTIKVWNVDPQDRNRNGRNYHKVANKVIKENKVTLGLMNHPEKMGDPKDVVAVEKNPRIIENWLVCDMTFLGDFGCLCESILEAGGPIQVSSSALGDVNEKTGEVLEEGFMLERYCDVVEGASNNILLFKDNSQQTETNEEIEILNAQLKETSIIEQDINKLEETLTILDKDNGEKIMSDKLLETTLTLNIKGMLKEATKTDNFTERKQILESALSAANELTDKSMIDVINKEIDKTNEEIHSLAEKGKTVGVIQENVDNLQKSLTEAKTEKEKSDAELVELKKAKEELELTHKTLVEMYEKKEYESGEETLEINKKLNKTVKLLRSNVKFLEEKINYLEALSNTKVEADVVINLKEKLTVAERKNRLLERKMEKVKDDESEFKNDDVEEYFNQLVEKDANIEKYLSKFIDCTSINEAQLVRLHLDENDKKPTPSTRIRETVRIEETDKKDQKLSAWEIEMKNRGLK